MKSKKEYQEPCMDVIGLDVENVVTTSETGVPWDDDWNDALENI